MKYLKTLYGKAIIDSSDSEEIQDDHKIELEYYATKRRILFKKESKPYGIEVVKKDIERNRIDVEKTVVNNICGLEQETKNLLDILVVNKVTPMSVEDIISDLKFSLG